MINKLSTIFLALVVASCAASLPYATDYPMTDTTVRSRDGLLNGKIPQGWCSATGDSIGTALTLLLISNSTDATLSVKEVKLDLLSVRQIKDGGLALLARISSAAKLERAGIVAKEPREFSINEKKFCSYELNDGTARSRIVVFSVKGRYYECEVRGGNKNWGGEQYSHMFTLQQSFLSSVTF